MQPSSELMEPSQASFLAVPNQGGDAKKSTGPATGAALVPVPVSIFKGSGTMGAARDRRRPLFGKENKRE